MNGNCIIRCENPFGGIYGLESLSQLIINSTLPGNFIYIYDEPVYKHRGIMIDTGRRYWPVDTVFIYYNID